MAVITHYGAMGLFRKKKRFLLEAMLTLLMPGYGLGPIKTLEMFYS